MAFHAAPLPSPFMRKNFGLVAWHPGKLVLHTQEKNDSFSQRATVLINSKGEVFRQVGTCLSKRLTSQEGREIFREHL